jgi:uncharacterized protein YodC (DUF2158 family)
MKPGDIVVLKSGGPRMTVKKVEDGLVSVIWFRGPFTGTWEDERTSTFPTDCLTLKVE